LHGLILITSAIQEKHFHEEAFITFASLLLPFFPLEKKGYGTFLKLVGSFWDLELR
jgi:hypothetical protein